MLIDQLLSIEPTLVNRLPCPHLRVAVITDIDANRPALEAVLGAVEAMGVDALYCGGDLVGYGPHLEDCGCGWSTARRARSTSTSLAPDGSGLHQEVIM